MRLTATLRRAVEEGDWHRVGLLACEAAALRRRLDGTEAMAELGEAVYGADAFHPVPATLALNGGLPEGTVPFETEHDAVLAQLVLLARQDAEWAPFYASRLRHFERRAQANDGGGRPRPAPADVRRAALAALERGDFSWIMDLAGRVEAEPARPLDAGPRLVAADETLAAPLPVRAEERASLLGLAPVTLPALPDYLDCMRRWCGNEAASPPSDMRPTLWETLELLVRRPFVTSAGTRYLPGFGPERMLVETFPETEADARGPLLDLLGLSRRRGASRLLLEEALHHGTAEVCAALGLDPFEFTAALIPFDAYLRLGPDRGWGRQALWTHFDGYQLTTALHLRAMVGGDVRTAARTTCAAWSATTTATT